MMMVVVAMVALSRSGAERTGNRQQSKNGDNAAGNLLHGKYSCEVK